MANNKTVTDIAYGIIQLCLNQGHDTYRIGDKIKCRRCTTVWHRIQTGNRKGQWLRERVSSEAIGKIIDKGETFKTLPESEVPKKES